MEKRILFSISLIASCILLCSGSATENASIGFENFLYESPESSSPRVCLVMEGDISSNFYVEVSTHIGVAGERLAHKLAMIFSVIINFR